MALVVASCGFPDHSFIDDSEFFGAKNSGGANAQAGGGGGADAGTSGRSNGGAGARAGTGGIGGGNGGTGGAVNGGSGNGGVQETGGLPSNGGVMTTIDGGRPKPDSGPDGSVGNGGAPPDAEVDAGPTCTTGLDLCPPGTCVDLLTDINHCGTCPNKCTAPNICVGGTCSPPCDPGLTACGGNCVDLDTSEAHCGACNRGCPSGTVCEGRQCLVDCGTLTRCPGNLCVDTSNDPLHCGGCSNPICTSGQLCSNGACRTNCTNPLVNCNNVCVNTNTDETHCGGCPGVACTSGQQCVNGSCQTLVENCQNGIDDDDDNLIDCADPNCTAFTCATTPLGWTGPVALWSGAAGAAPSCAGAYPSDLLDAHANLVVPSYTCPGCTCTPQNAQCPALQFYYDTTTSCSSSSAWFIDVDASGTCTPLFLLQGQAGSARSSQLVPPANHDPDPISAYASGNCVGSQPNAQFPSPSWTTDVLACGASATSAGGCGAGQCLPKPATPFNTKLCIFRPGINSCPSGYPNPMPSAQNPQYYAAYTDGRTCSQCSCAPPTCGGTVRTFTDGACTANSTAVDITGGCTTIPADPTPGSGPKTDTRSIRWDNGGAVCGSATSALNGSVTPDTPVTVCCQN